MSVSEVYWYSWNSFLIGLLNDNEVKILEELSKRSDKLYYVPLLWASAIISQAKDDGILKSYSQWKGCVDHINEYRNKLARTLRIEMINIPLAYSQVRDGRISFGDGIDIHLYFLIYSY